MVSLTLFLVPFIFILGLCIGSFVNVVVMRTLIGEEFVHGRSRCDACRRELQWFEMIPLISYLVLRGRCRTCHKEIDMMHPVVELLTGTLFVWWLLIGFAFFQLTSQPLLVLQSAFWLVVGLLLLIIVVFDLRAYVIPDLAVLALSFLVIFYRLVLITFAAHQATDFALALMGGGMLLAAFLFLWLITKKQGFGFGDVKLIFPLALLMGWPRAFVGVFLAFLIGAVVGVGLIFTGRARFGKPIPFGPFLVLGTILALLWGDSLLRWYLGLL